MWFFKEKIDTSLVMKFGFLGGIAEALYCSLVASLIMFLDKTMSQPPTPILGLVFMLLLLVFSVGVSGLLIFGYPTYLAFQKRFAEGLMAAITSLITLVIIGLLVFVLFSWL